MSYLCVDAAFGSLLDSPSPSAGSLETAQLSVQRTGPAAKTSEPVVVEWMIWNIEFPNVGPYLILGPICERIDLNQAPNLNHPNILAVF